MKISVFIYLVQYNDALLHFATLVYIIYTYNMHVYSIKHDLANQYGEWLGTKFITLQDPIKSRGRVVECLLKILIIYITLLITHVTVLSI